MKGMGDGGCARVSAEDLLLYAYGESGDQGLAEHVRECEACRSYVEAVRSVRTLAARAESVRAGDAVVARLTARAREITDSPPARRPNENLVVLPWRRRWAPALAAAAVIAMMVVSGGYLAHRDKPLPPTSRNEVPAYLADASSQLLSLEAELDNALGTDLQGDTEDASGDTGIWEWVASPDNGFDDLEDSIDDVEAGLSILGVYGAANTETK